jgi:hypothetical protein
MRKLDQFIHNLLCHGVHHTPPLEMKPAPVSICSLVSRRDFTMYLVAIKSFYSHFGRGQVVALNDGSLTRGQMECLRRQIPGILLMHIEDIPYRRVPRGGCWERLLCMIGLADEGYVIQLDSDTLTRGPVAEVLDACRQQRPFIIAGDREGTRITSRADAAPAASQSEGVHVQTAMEGELPRTAGLKPFYVRGCAAFFGMPPGSLSFSDVEDFSDRMQKRLGARWREWGTEQATVNYFLANMPDTLVLQPPKYTHRWKTAPGDDSAFVHFIGTHRFEGHFYALQSRRVIRELNRPLFKPQFLGGAAV